MSVHRFFLKWTGGEYKVSKPNIGSMEVINAAEFDEALDVLEVLLGKNALHSMSRTSEPDAVGRVSGTWGAEAEDKARALIAKHRGGV